MVLKTGEFIHMRPHGMAQVGPGFGTKASAVSEVRMMVQGTRLLEAREVNRIELG